MTNWRKAAIWSGGTLLLLALAGAVTLHTLVDPERLEEIARERAQAAWGRDLSIGDVSLDLWPVPALHAQDIALSNPAWAQEPHLLRAESLTANLALLPLLTGKVRVKSLFLEGVTAALETSADGTSNVPSSGARETTASSASELLSLTDVGIKGADIYQRRKDGSPTLWHIDEATFEASADLRDVSIQASLARNQFPLAVSAHLDDLSRFGDAGATTEGRIDLDWGNTQLAIAGKLPIGPGLQGYAITADLKSASLIDMLAFLEVTQRPRAAAAAHLQIRDAQGRTDVTRLDITLGQFRVTGEAQLSLSSAKKTFHMRLESDRMDWAQTMLDAGGRVIPPLPPDRSFQDIPLAWPLLVALQGTQGTADVRVRSLKLRNGVMLENVRSRIAFEDDRMSLDPFTTETLGGTVTGSVRLEGRRKSVKTDFIGTNLLLQRWFEERGSPIPLTGGAMKIVGKFSATGNSMKGLAATVTGPMTIRMGPAVWVSKKAGMRKR